MLKLIPLLAEPGRHGAVDSDAFDVVVPSLPGFGFSDHPVSAGVNVFSIAAMWADLMAELGYPKFAA
jgi:pimeloyl-ACP methyl ester carboxylesterase